MTSLPPDALPAGEVLARVEVGLGRRSYPILIGSGIHRLPSNYDMLPRGDSCAIVTNTTVGPLHAEALEECLKSRFRRIVLVVLPDGENYKDWVTLQQVFDELLEARCDRRTLLFALGGGVVGDMTGFAAACFMRGIGYVQVPTTLLAQVDSSVGGKTGINHPAGKNMIGAFVQPQAVIADLDFLRTLPQRELIAGLAEVIKYGAIADLDFLDWLELNMGALLAKDPAALAHAIRRSCEIKAAVVSADEREAGPREVLNFGHTFAHAIEAGMGFGEWLHGEAVGCGMVMAANLSARLGWLDAAFAERLERLIAAAGLPTRGPALSPERYIELMSSDKKALGGQIRFVLIDTPGHAQTRTVDQSTLSATLEAFTG